MAIAMATGSPRTKIFVSGESQSYLLKYRPHWHPWIHIITLSIWQPGCNQDTCIFGRLETCSTDSHAYCRQQHTASPHAYIFFFILAQQVFLQDTCSSCHIFCHVTQFNIFIFAIFVSSSGKETLK